jgi:hypothetical protein
MSLLAETACERYHLVMNRNSNNPIPQNRLLPPASSSWSSNTRSDSKGRFDVVIVSVNDLESRIPPRSVEIVVRGNSSSSSKHGRTATSEESTIPVVYTMSTGPPAQRHKDRNSFKFSSSSNNTTTSSSSSSPLSIDAPLSELYNATATFRICYDPQQLSPETTPTTNNNTMNAAASNTNTATALTATYPLDQLPINETTWLILQLDTNNKISIMNESKTGTDNNQNDDDDDKKRTGGEVEEVVEEDENGPLPTLKLQLTLSGPYRPEIGFFLFWLAQWFQFVDTVTDTLWKSSQQPMIKTVTQMDPKWWLLPTAPIAATIVALTPILIGCVLLFFPIAMPILFVMGVALVCGACGVGTFYASTRMGRKQIQEFVTPIGQALFPPSATALSSSSSTAALPRSSILATFLYDTGPRPTPVRIARQFLIPHGIWGRLIVSLLLDFIGSASFCIPVAGEGFDVIWAPLQTIFVAALYDETSPKLKYVSFLEEFLPFTDILPSATCGWLMEFGLPLLVASVDPKTNRPHPNPPVAAASTTTR